MKIAIITAFLTALLLPCSKAAAAEAPGNASPTVARVLEKNITADAIGLKCDANNKPVLSEETPSSCLARNPVDKLGVEITREVMRDYIKKNKLGATDEEIHELQDYQNQFMAQDRIKRQKQLAELEKQLKDTKLNPKDREQAEKYRSTLLSLAEHDKQRNAMDLKLTGEQMRSINGPWIEAWKFNKSIYEKYGGTVSITKFGPDPVGATKSLLEKYEKEGKLVIFDKNLRNSFWRRMSRPPQITAKPEEIDFTPFWKKPIPK